MRLVVAIAALAAACSASGEPEPPAPPLSGECAGDDIRCEAPTPTMWSIDELGTRWDCTPELVEIVPTWTWDNTDSLYLGATNKLAANSTGQLLHFGGWYYPEPRYPFVRQDTDGTGRELFSLETTQVHAMALGDDGCAYISTGGTLVQACDDGHAPLFDIELSRTRVALAADGTLLISDGARAARVRTDDASVVWRQTFATNAALYAEWVDVKARPDGGLTLGMVGGSRTAQIAILDGSGNVVVFGQLPGVVEMDFDNLDDGRVGASFVTQSDELLVALLGTDGQWQWSIAPRNEDGELLTKSHPVSMLYDGHSLVAEQSESLIFYDMRQGPNDGQHIAYAVEISAAGDGCRIGRAGATGSDSIFYMPYGLTDAPGRGFFHDGRERSEFPAP